MEVDSQPPPSQQQKTEDAKKEEVKKDAEKNDIDKKDVVKNENKDNKEPPKTDPTPVKPTNNNAKSTHPTSLKELASVADNEGYTPLLTCIATYAKTAEVSILILSRLRDILLNLVLK